MTNLVPFLDKYDKILFDMDGVITSEQNYWDIAALVVLEMLDSNKYFGSSNFEPARYQNSISECRSKVFCNDKIIILLKNYGVNSNWDLGYFVFQAAKVLDTHDFNKVYEYLKELNCSAFELYEILSAQFAKKLNLPLSRVQRLGEIWRQSVFCFQEWYVGDAMFRKSNNRAPMQTGKQGMFEHEEPLFPKDRLIELFALLTANGKILGVGTGRPDAEIKEPLSRWGFDKYFDSNSIVTYDSVITAESRLCGKNAGLGLTKPHPYMFVKGALGNDFDDNRIVSGDYPKDVIQRTLAVGDAGADLFAAKNAGMDFLAVLTGINGESARGFFEKENATYILDNVLNLME